MRSKFDCIWKLETVHADLCLGSRGLTIGNGLIALARGGTMTDLGGPMKTGPRRRNCAYVVVMTLNNAARNDSIIPTI